MAEQAYILDIDTKFLDNVQKIDQYLANAAKTAYDFTEKFKDLANSSGTFAGRMKALEEEVARIGKLKVNDLGLATITVDAKEAIDNANVLNQRLSALRDQWVAVTAKGNTSGLVSERDLDNISDLRAAIKTLKEELNTKQMSSEKRQAYVAELELYQKMVKEMMKSNETLSKEEAKRLQREFNESVKYAEELLKIKEQSKRKEDRDEAKRVSDIRKEYSELLNVQKSLVSIQSQIQRHQNKYGATTQSFNNLNEVLNRRIAISARISEMEAEFQKELSALVQKGELQRIKIETDSAEIRAQITANDHNKIRADFQKLLHDQAKLSEAYHKAEMLRINGKSNGDLSNRIASREAAVNRQIQDMQMKHQNVLTDLMVQAEDQRTNIAVNKARHRAIEANAAERAQREREAKINSTPTGAMAFSQGADSIAERKQAIKYLEKARDELKQSATSASSYKSEVKKLNDEMKRQQKEVDKLVGKQRTLRTSQKQLSDTAKLVKNTLGTVFAVEAIRNYINQVVKVRAEFELQRKSLEVLLQSKKEANELWKQTVELGVKSPFTIKELSTYTKQLAAYRIESSKLHDTTRMLADVSAGLGVDMSRLILAYGQVRSATFLRATELRQFTEAGVPMLDELAKHFESLEGKAVSTGEVFERISKRMVSFRDVEDVLKRLTSEGGAFFQMQEIQAKTLSGQLSNLKDAIDLMLNDIGESHQLTMTLVLKAITGVVRGFETWLPLATSAGLAFLAMSLQAKLAARGITGLGSSFGYLGSMIKKALPIMKGFSAAAGVLFLIGEVVSVIQKSVLKFRAINAEANRLNSIINKTQSELREVFDGKSIDTDKAIAKIKELADFAKKEFDVRFNIDDEDLKKKTPEQLKQLADDMAQTLEGANATAQNLLRKYADGYNFLGMNAFGARGKWSLGGEDMVQDIKQFEKITQKLSNNILVDYRNLTTTLEDMAEEHQITLTETEKNAIKTLRQKRGEQESEYEYLERMAKAYDVLSGAIKRSGYESEVSAGQLRRFSRRTKEVTQELEGWLEANMPNMDNLSQEEKEIRIQYAIDTLAAEKQWTDFTKYLAYEAANTKFNISIGFKYDKDTVTLEPWQDLYNQKFEGKEGFSKIFDPKKTRDQVIDGLRSVGQAVQKELERKKKDPEGYADVSLEVLEQQLADVTAQLAFFGVTLNETKSSSTRAKDAWSGLLRTVKDYYNKFTELNKENDLEYAGAKAAEYYAHAFTEALKGIQIDGKTLDVDSYLKKYDLRTLDGVIQALRDISKYSTDAETRVSALLSAADFQVDKDKYQKSLEKFDLTRDIEEMFSGYELSIELDKLNVPKDLAADLFGIKTFDLTELKRAVEELRPKFQGTKGYKEYQAYLDRITKMEEKAQEERLKKYVGYLVKGQGERVKIKLDEMRQIAEIESLPFDDAQKKLAREAVHAEANKRIKKLDWEEFKDSGMYVRLFEDLEFASSRTLKLMREKLIELKSQLSDLDADDLKHLYDQIEKLDNELVERNPYKALAESADEYFKSLKRLKEAEAELSHAEDVEKGLASRVSDVDVKLSKEKSVYEQMSKSKDATSEDLKKQREKIEALNAQLAMLKAQLLAQGKLTADLENEIDALTKARKMFTGSAEEIGRDISEAANALPQVAGHLENVFGTMSDGTRDTLDSIATIGGGIGDAIAGFASNNPVQGIMGIAQAIGGIFAIGDKAKERKIQRELQHVDELDKRYQEIDEALDRMYNSRQMAAYTKELNDNIDSQIDSYERMRALEEDKKKSDQAKIDEYNQSIEDLNKRREEMFAEQQSKATGGILDDALSAAEGFVDAWYDAFQETGDGLFGLENNFKDMLSNLMKKQAAMQIVGNFTKKYSDWLKDYINAEAGDPELTAEEARQWAERVQATFPELSNMLENFFSGTQDLLQEQGELSELSKGIQGVTESTAQVLEALLNSMRFYVADSNVQLKNIANALISNDVEANPLLNELRQQTAMIRSIESMFDSVIGRGGSSHIGGYVKVKID